MRELFRRYCIKNTRVRAIFHLVSSWSPRRAGVVVGGGRVVVMHSAHTHAHRGSRCHSNNLGLKTGGSVCMRVWSM